MRGRIVERDRPIAMRAAFRDVPGAHQGSAHKAMSDHERDGSPLLLCECQELRRERAYPFAIERLVTTVPGRLRENARPAP